jgi:hypothetical protein
VLGLTTAPWFETALGLVTICLVAKSRRSMTAMRLPALSLMNSHFPSYSPLVSLRAGWWVSPHARRGSLLRQPRMVSVSSEPVP